MLGALPVLDHLDREPAADRGKGPGEGVAVLAGQHRPRTAGHDEQRVGGAHLGIDADAVEGCGCRVGHDRLEVLGRDGGVGGDVGEHRRHVGADHARALGGGADGDLAGAEAKPEGAALGSTVGGADGAPELGAAVGRQLADGVDDAAPGDVEIDPLADRARAADRDLALVDVERRRRPPRHRVGVLETGRAGGRVGLAGVDHDRAQPRPVERAVADHRGRGQGAGGVDERGGDRGEREQDAQVEGVRRLQPARHTRGVEARRRAHRPAGDRRQALGGVEPVGADDGGQAQSRPSVSGRPAIRLRFCTAWPAAPLPMLSMTPNAVTRPPRGSTTGQTWA